MICVHQKLKNSKRCVLECVNNIDVTCKNIGMICINQKLRCKQLGRNQIDAFQDGFNLFAKFRVLVTILFVFFGFKFIKTILGDQPAIYFHLADPPAFLDIARSKFDPRKHGSCVGPRCICMFMYMDCIIKNLMTFTSLKNQ